MIEIWLVEEEYPSTHTSQEAVNTMPDFLKAFKLLGQKLVTCVISFLILGYASPNSTQSVPASVSQESSCQF